MRYYLVIMWVLLLQSCSSEGLVAYKAPSRKLADGGTPFAGVGEIRAYCERSCRNPSSSMKSCTSECLNRMGSLAGCLDLCNMACIEVCMTVEKSNLAKDQEKEFIPDLPGSMKGSGW